MYLCNHLIRRAFLDLFSRSTNVKLRKLLRMGHMPLIPKSQVGGPFGLFLHTRVTAPCLFFERRFTFMNSRLLLKMGCMPLILTS